MMGKQYICFKVTVGGGHSSSIIGVWSWLY